MASTIIEFILVLIAHAAAGIYSSTLKYSKKITYIIWGIWIGFFSVIIYCTEFVLTNRTSKFLVGFVLSIISQYAIFFITTKGRILQRIFTMLTYSIFFCIVMTFFTMVKGTFPNIHVIQPIISGAILLGVMYYFLCYVCPLCSRAAKNITRGWAWLIFVNIFFFITVILSSVFPVRLTSFSEPSVITFIFLSLSVLVVYPVVFSNINILSEVATKREVENQNKLLLAQIEVENMQHTAECQARHDRRNHNLVLLEFAQNNDIESVREYLQNLVESETNIRKEAKYCDNVTINTVLNVYERRANERNIAVKVSVNAGRELAVTSQDLVVVIANLFENAINATAKLKNADRFIDISIKESEQRLLIKVENSCRHNMYFDESVYGIGINSVISTTQKYDGMYDFSAKDEKFSAKISLNLK